VPSKATDLYRIEKRDLLLRKAEVCGFIRAYLHPNIAQYLGFAVENGITGLFFFRYGMTSPERVARRSCPFDAGLVLHGFPGTSARVGSGVYRADGNSC
jgi:hypothetical protein